MNSDLSTVMFRCFVMILCTLISTVVIPYIKAKIGEEKWKRLQEYTLYAVRYAEQCLDDNEEKKKYVYDYIMDKAYMLGIGLDERDIDLLVEAVVNIVKEG